MRRMLWVCKENSEMLSIAILLLFCQGDLRYIIHAHCSSIQVLSLHWMRHCTATSHSEMCLASKDRSERTFLHHASIQLTGACITGARQQRRPEDPFRHCVSPRSDRRAEGAAAAGLAARLSWAGVSSSPVNERIFATALKTHHAAH